MKRFTSHLLGFIAVGAILFGSGLAAPRSFQYPDYTRVVLDLPRPIQFKVLEGSSSLNIAIKGVSLPAESGFFDSRELSGFRVSSSGGDSKWTLLIRKGEKPHRVFLLKDPDGKARLVVDYGTTGGPTPTALNLPKAKTALRTNMRVVLDPGHGGTDSGMNGYVMEKELTLDVAKRVGKLLEDSGVEAVYTRSTDVQLTLDYRARQANAGTVNAFVSIHVNSAASSSAQGIETFVFGRPLDKSSRSLAVKENGGGTQGEAVTKKAETLASNLIGNLLASSNLELSRSMAQRVQGKLIANTAAVNRGVKSDYFYVIRFAHTPAILIETGFGNHPVEGRKLATDAYRDILAEAIADGILEFLKVK